LASLSGLSTPPKTIIAGSAAAPPEATSFLKALAASAVK
jgi:hypothetical protein